MANIDIYKEIFNVIDYINSFLIAITQGLMDSFNLLGSQKIDFNSKDEISTSPITANILNFQEKDIEFKNKVKNPWDNQKCLMCFYHFWIKKFIENPRYSYAYHFPMKRQNINLEIANFISNRNPDVIPPITVQQCKSKFSTFAKKARSMTQKKEQSIQFSSQILKFAQKLSQKFSDDKQLRKDLQKLNQLIKNDSRLMKAVNKSLDARKRFEETIQKYKEHAKRADNQKDKLNKN